MTAKSPYLSAPVTELLKNKPVIAGGVPEGFDAMLLGALAAAAGTAGKPLLHIARDGQRLAGLQAAISFFAPDVEQLVFPAWDCVPYDRVAPNGAFVAERISSLSALAKREAGNKPLIVLTTVNAAMQRVPPKDFVSASVQHLKPGQVVKMAELVEGLEMSGYARASTVTDPGQYAVRGGIVDLFPPGGQTARLDFFGDQLETVKCFDPETQRSTATLEELTLRPMSELALTPETRRAFRQRYIELFGPVTSEDPLYEAISAGHQHQGMEHWLPLFHDRLETLFDYLPDAAVSLDPLDEDAKEKRLEQIQDHYEAREQALERKAFGAAPYNPVPPESLYLTGADWDAALSDRSVVRISPFEQPDGAEGAEVISFGGRHGRSFAAERKAEGGNVFDAVVSHIKLLRQGKKRALIACWTPGARERLSTLLQEHGLSETRSIDSFAEIAAIPRDIAAFGVLPLETGFEAPGLAVIGEQDILGDRLVRRSRPKKGSDVLTEASSLTVGDLVVHADHGIGRFAGLNTIEAVGQPHDCLELTYSGGDKLYLPVENIDLLSRFGSEEQGVQLDKLGGVGWQSRKAKLKKRIRDIAEKLIKVAALRELRSATPLYPPEGVYQEFSARFPYEETGDQANAIEAVVEDLGSGKPMDRLICGDVGFGKTEVALRAALIAVLAGKQVAVVVPTTLLARQHYATFVERFRGLPVKIAQASRLVSTKELNETKKQIASGDIDIVVGTHALLGKSIEFGDLGLLIIDEEQHFGVGHKERLKQLREDVHVLTLTATPIPRTLQLALSGVREMSIIATPPVDRLAVRTYVTPFDPVILREALLRERYRGGQTFYVVPRISYLEEAGEFLAEHVPELKVGKAHGQMGSKELDQVMNAFYDRQYDVLLSTSIVESGLDIPSANTMIVHRADMFGLAALYQLRGRVGRSKIRAYAYFTVPSDRRLTPAAEKRLKVLQSLDSLGAGFMLASHDLDLRGAGNLLGEEQSGHIREVGYELYQSMLEEAIQAMKGGDEGEVEDQWSPRINLGTAVLIPEDYVPDLQLRLGLYRRLSSAEDSASIEAFAAEMIDRFGPLPLEVRHLLDVVEIKRLCRQAGVEQIDAGPKGAVLAFRNKSFANPEGLIAFIAKEGAGVKLQPDHKLVYYEDWPTPEDRLNGAREVLKQLARIAGEVKEAA